MAPKSSITANAVRKIFNDSGTRFPNNESTARAKAMSVAIGIPAPACIQTVIKYKVKTRRHQHTTQAATTGSSAQECRQLAYDFTFQPPSPTNKRSP